MPRASQPHNDRTTTCPAPVESTPTCTTRSITQLMSHQAPPHPDSLFEAEQGHTNASPDPAGGPPPVLSVKKVYAGRGAVDYYLAQTRRGLADYYLPEATTESIDDDSPALTAPGSSWWGGGARSLGLAGSVERREFVPLYAKAARPDGDGYLGHRFRLPAQAAAARDAALSEAETIEDPYDRWMAQHAVRQRGWRASVAAWDCTFSPVKSVSLLWASGDHDVQQQVWAAHAAAVDAGLTYLEEHAAYVRAGRNGVRVHETSGLVVARMNEWTSRDGDMQLHTHCLVLNRSETTVDGRWRALDGRCLLGARAGAGALYSRVLEAELTRRLGVAWRERPDGLREVAGIDDDVIELFSTRRRHITTEVSDMVAAYRDRHGIEPPPAVISSMAQQATLQTRRRKEKLAPDDALDRWEATARDHGLVLRDLPARVAAAAQSHVFMAGSRSASDDVAAVLARLEALPRATFSDHDLLRVALDVTAPGDRSSRELRREAEALADRVSTCPALMVVTSPDPIEVGQALCRADGTSVFDRPSRRRWALQATLSREAWLLQVATERYGGPLPDRLLDEATAAHDLGGDQAAALRQLLGSDERIGLLVGPAGTGKTRTLRAIADAWQTHGGSVLGLTVSQSAAAVLADETGIRTENTAKWLHESRRHQWQLPQRPLLLVDEASMVATTELVSLVEQVRAAGGKVLLVGDPAQLSAIHIGGAFDLLADRHGATRLHEVRRFEWPWERDASRQLRDRDPGALAAYAMRSRIRGGRLTGVEDQLFRAWRDDAIGSATLDDRRRAVLMVVATNEQVALLGERARRELIEAGVVSPGPTVDVRHGVASRGDHLVTRRNARDLMTSTGRFVVNGDVWTIEQVHADGSATVRSHDDHGTVTLEAAYLRSHAHLAYATTAHRAQGMTVDRAHALVRGDTSHELLYVSATRGRESNHLWAAVDSGTDEIRDEDDLPTPEHVLASILARRDPDRLSAHQVIEDSQHEMGSLARLGSVFEDLARVTTERWVANQLRAHELETPEDDRHWPALIARVRQLALDGYDVEKLMGRALTMRTWGDDVASQAALLHWRLGAVAATVAPGRARGPLGSLPPVTGPEHDVAVQVGELIRERWRQIRADVAALKQPPEWLDELGARPSDPRDESAWLTAATAVIAYRERYEVAPYVPLIGTRPSVTRPDARAAWDHARRRCDDFLVRDLARLSIEELDELEQRLREVMDAGHTFDPAELATAMASPTPLAPAVSDLEQSASSFENWRQDAAVAAERLRLLAEARRKIGVLGHRAPRQRR